LKANGTPCGVSLWSKRTCPLDERAIVAEHDALAVAARELAPPRARIRRRRALAPKNSRHGLRITVEERGNDAAVLILLARDITALDVGDFCVEITHLREIVAEKLPCHGLGVGGARRTAVPELHHAEDNGGGRNDDDYAHDEPSEGRAGDGNSPGFVVVTHAPQNMTWLYEDLRPQVRLPTGHLHARHGPRA